MTEPRFARAARSALAAACDAAAVPLAALAILCGLGAAFLLRASGRMGDIK